MEFRVEKLVYGGDGLARLPPDEHGPGKSVFVPFVLPEDRIQAEITEQKAGFARARLEAIIEPAPERIPAGCPYFEKCGGCHYQHTSYDRQLRIKADILHETLRRTAKIELPCELNVHPSPPWNYRNRTRMKVQHEPDFALGLYRFRSHELLPVEECPISSPLINRAIRATWEFGRSGRLAAEVREIEFFANAEDDAMLMEVYCTPGAGNKAHAVADALQELMPEVAGVAAMEQPRAGQLAGPKELARSGNPEFIYHAKLASYRVGAGCFFQVNRFLLDDLVKLVTSGSDGHLGLDLYAGVGLFSAVLARSFAQVTAVESSQTSHIYLRQNAGPEVRAVRESAQQFLQHGSGTRPDLVVADPPRGGLGESVVRSLAGADVPRITYVSCDPSTLARDLRTFVGLGYRIEGAHLIDLFPQTFHIESILRLAR